MASGLHREILSLNTKLKSNYKKKAWRKKNLLLIYYRTEYWLVTQTQNSNHNLGVRSESNLFLMIMSNLESYYYIT